MTNIPTEAHQVLSILQTFLGESLVAVYLHGSAIMGGLRPHSDIDILAIIDKPLTPKIKQRLVTEFMKISGQYPPNLHHRRPLEIIIFLQSNLSLTVYPPRSELIYGEWLREAYENSKIPDTIRDPEFVVILAQAKQEAISLMGPEAITLLPSIEWSNIKRAMLDILPMLLENVESDERNVVLTLARIWRTMLTRQFVSKDVAAQWAAAYLPPKQAAVLYVARADYLGLHEGKATLPPEITQQTIRTLRDAILSSARDSFPI